MLPFTFPVSRIERKKKVKKIFHFFPSHVTPSGFISLWRKFQLNNHKRVERRRRRRYGKMTNKRWQQKKEGNYSCEINLIFYINYVRFTNETNVSQQIVFVYFLWPWHWMHLCVLSCTYNIFVRGSVDFNKAKMP